MTCACEPLPGAWCDADGVTRCVACNRERGRAGQSLEAFFAETGELGEVRAMADAKRARLEADGWAFGTAAAFLGDDPEAA